MLEVWASVAHGRDACFGVDAGWRIVHLRCLMFASGEKALSNTDGLIWMTHWVFESITGKDQQTKKNVSFIFILFLDVEMGSCTKTHTALFKVSWPTPPPPPIISAPCCVSALRINDTCWQLTQRRKTWTTICHLLIHLWKRHEKREFFFLTKH